jgi:integrase
MKHYPDIRAKAMFLMYATTGLRPIEVRQLKLIDIDLEKRMIIPRRSTRSKRTYVTFFNSEAEKALQVYLKTRNDDNPRLFPIRTDNLRAIWRIAREKTGLRITPLALRR